MIPIRSDKDGALLLPIKVVPGAKGDQIVGQLGTRLKVRVSAPPEQGKANQSVAELLATALGLARNRITIAEGHASPSKLVRIVGIDEAALRRKLDLELPDR